MNQRSLPGGFEFYEPTKTESEGSNQAGANQQGQILAGAKPALSREEVAQRVMEHLEARILDIRKLLIQADRILARHRCQGMVAGLSGK
jgi:hypothetical protein